MIPKSLEYVFLLDGEIELPLQILSLLPLPTQFLMKSQAMSATHSLMAFQGITRYPLPKKTNTRQLLSVSLDHSPIGLCHSD